MKFTLTKSQRLVTNAATRDRSRPTLTCVHIRKGVIEAGDGFIVVQTVIDYEGEENFLLESKALAKLKGDIILDKEENAKEVKIGGGGTLETPKGDFPIINIHYPKGTVSNEVLARLADKEGVFKIALSRDNLLKLLKCFNNDKEIIRIYFYGTDKPIKFATGVTRGLLMPMVIDWDRAEKEEGVF